MAGEGCDVVDEPLEQPRKLVTIPWWPAREEIREHLAAEPSQLVKRRAALVGEGEERGAAVERVGSSRHEGPPLQVGYLAAHRGHVHAEKSGELGEAQRSGVGDVAQHAVGGPVDAGLAAGELVMEALDVPTAQESGQRSFDPADLRRQVGRGAGGGRHGRPRYSLVTTTNHWRGRVVGHSTCRSWVSLHRKNVQC